MIEPFFELSDLKGILKLRNRIPNCSNFFCGGKSSSFREINEFGDRFCCVKCKKVIGLKIEEFEKRRKKMDLRRILNAKNLKVLQMICEVDNISLNQNQIQKLFHKSLNQNRIMKLEIEEDENPLNKEDNDVFIDSFKFKNRMKGNDVMTEKNIIEEERNELNRSKYGIIYYFLVKVVSPKTVKYLNSIKKNDEEEEGEEDIEEEEYSEKNLCYFSQQILQSLNHFKEFKKTIKSPKPRLFDLLRTLNDQEIKIIEKKDFTVPQYHLIFLVFMYTLLVKGLLRREEDGKDGIKGQVEEKMKELGLEKEQYDLLMMILVHGFF